MAQVRSSSSKESIDETSPEVALRYAPTAAVRRGRSARQGIRLGVTLLPLASLAVDEELLLGTPEKVLKAAFFPEVRRLATNFERPSSNGAKSSLPRAMPCQHCAVPAIMRMWQLEGMWSKVLAGSRRILWVKFVGSCS